jgi:hypothetical protein
VGRIKMGSRLFRVGKQELKKILLDFSVDMKGRKVTKFNLCRNREFLDKIGCNREKISFNSIQSWYKRLENFEPVGEMTDKFIFEYHRNVTKRIPLDMSYYNWTKDKANIKSVESELSIKMKESIGWNERKKHFAILKMNDTNFDISRYLNLSDRDLKFLVNMYIDTDKYNLFEKKLEDMIERGDENIVEYLV